MLELENREYRGEEVGSPFYWMSQLVVRSGTQHLKRLEKDILSRASASAAHDARSLWVSSSAQTANILTMGVNLDADEKLQAMIKISGLTLLAMRRTGVNIEDLILEDGRLASGWSLAQAVASNPEATIYDHSHSLTPQLQDIFTDMQGQMIAYDSDDTYLVNG